MAIFERATIREYIFNDSSSYFWMVGDSTKPSLLLIPGFSGTYSDLLHFATLLKDNYFVIIPDLPGWGKSPTPKTDLTIQYYAKYLIGLLKTLGIDQINILGHCMGSLIAIEIAHSDSTLVKSLYLVSPPYLDGTLTKQLFLQLSEMAKHSSKSVRRIFFIWRNRFFSMSFYFFALQFKSFKKRLKRIIFGFFDQSKHKQTVVEDNWNSLIHFDFDKLKELKQS